MKKLIYDHGTDVVQPYMAEGFCFSLVLQQRFKINTKNSFKGMSRYLLVFSEFSGKGQGTNACLSKKFILEMVLMLFPTANTFSPLQVS